MRILINENTNPNFNLASEEYLLENTSGDIFILWRNAPAVIIGKNQNAFAEINFDFTNKNNIKVVRRLTGGGAVFHDLGNLNFTFISENKNENNEIDFARFTQPIIEALSKLGVKAVLSGRNDILAEYRNVDGAVEMRKISGNAQCVYNTKSGAVKTMHHGTLLFNADMSYLQGALNVDAEKLKSKGIKSVRSRVANIYSLFSDEVKAKINDTIAFRDYLTDFAAEKFGVQAEMLTEEMIEGIKKLTEEKYATDDWNINRFGSFETSKKKRFDYGSVEIFMTVKNGVIENISIGGDFFGVKNTDELSALLKGIAFDCGVVEKLLNEINIHDYIMGANAKDIASLICF